MMISKNVVYLMCHQRISASQAIFFIKRQSSKKSGERFKKYSDSHSANRKREWTISLPSAHCLLKEHNTQSVWPEVGSITFIDVYTPCLMQPPADFRQNLQFTHLLCCLIHSHPIYEGILRPNWLSEDHSWWPMVGKLTLPGTSCCCYFSKFGSG